MGPEALAVLFAWTAAYTWGMYRAVRPRRRTTT